MSAAQYSLSSPIDFLARFLDHKINESVGTTEETTEEARRRYLFMEFISSETEYLEMLKLYSNTYLAWLNKTDHVAWQMTYVVVRELVVGHEQLLQLVFEWLELPMSINEYKSEINWELHVTKIGGKFQSLESLTKFIAVYVEQLLKLEAYYKSYIYHYSLCNTFKTDGIFNSKLIKRLCQMEPMLKKFQQQRLNSQSTDLFKRNISFESLRHLPIARLGHYKVFFDSFLQSIRQLPEADLLMRSVKNESLNNWEQFQMCLLSIQNMLLRIDGENFSNLIDKLSQRISRRIEFKDPDEYVSIPALGMPQLTGVLNTIWIEVNEGQKLWNNTVRSIDTWRRKKQLYPIFSPKGKQLGAFLYKSYLILVRITSNPTNSLETQDTWKIKFAIPLINCKLIAIDKETTRYNEIGLHDSCCDSIKLFKLEWFLYGDIFETIFIFDNDQDYQRWHDCLETVMDLNGFTSRPMEAESVENYFQMSNSVFAPLNIAPKLSFADSVSKVLNPNLTRRQYNLVNHPAQDYYNYTSFKLKVRFEPLKMGPTNQSGTIVYSRDKYSYLERQVFALQHPFESLPMLSPTKHSTNSDSNLSTSATATQVSESNTSLRTFSTLRTSWCSFASSFSSNHKLNDCS